MLINRYEIENPITVHRASRGGEGVGILEYDTLANR